MSKAQGVMRKHEVRGMIATAIKDGTCKVTMLPPVKRTNTNGTSYRVGGIKVKVSRH